MSHSSQKRFLTMLKTVLAVLCLIVATIVATLYYTQPQKFSALNPLQQTRPVESPSTVIMVNPDKIPAPVFLALEPFTAMLRDAQGRRRVLYTAITLRVDDENVRGLLMDYMPEVRDRILRKLSEQEPAAIQIPEGRTRLAKKITEVLEAVYHPYLPAPRIHGVLFTAFVVQ